jgi:ribose transport system permease protein
MNMQTRSDNESEGVRSKVSIGMRHTPPVFKRLLEARESIIFLVVIASSIFLTFASGVFLSGANFEALLLGMSINLIVATGITILLISGEFDLSVGSILGLTGAIAALCSVNGIPVILSIIIALLLGMAIGFFNGILVTKVGISSFVTTIGSMYIFRGVLYVISHGSTVSGLSKSFTVLGQGKVLGVQYPIIIAVAIVILFNILLRHSMFFRQNFYIGGNARSALFSGINVGFVKRFNFVLSGLLCAIAGILLTSRLAAATVVSGMGLEMQVIAASVIGGASLSGGEGSIVGAFLGCVLMALITNALNLLSVDIYWNNIVIGAVLLAAVVIDVLNRRKRGIS